MAKFPEIAYIVSYTIGYYDEERVKFLFVTFDKIEAQKYCDKFNSKLDFWKQYWESIYNKPTRPFLDYKKSKVSRIVEIQYCEFEEIKVKFNPTYNHGQKTNND